MSMYSDNKLALLFGNYNLILLVDSRNNYPYSTVLRLKTLLKKIIIKSKNTS